MAIIRSRILGTVEIDESRHIRFSQGPFGFEEYHEFYLLDMDKDGIFHVLQSVDDENLSFIVIPPGLLFSWYQLDIHSNDLAELGIRTLDDVLVFLIVTVPERMADMTANLQGPIVINKVTMTAKQCIALNDNYSTRHPVVAKASA
ncbi:MAG: flagellar assembly protein FliW [Spirochaetes bacterium]|nr:flagellar assembly protein FliW [Spirochaetota bacterium]